MSPRATRAASSLQHLRGFYELTTLPIQFSTLPADSDTVCQIYKELLSKLRAIFGPTFAIEITKHSSNALFTITLKRLLALGEFSSKNKTIIQSMDTGSDKLAGSGAAAAAQWCSGAVAAAQRQRRSGRQRQRRPTAPQWERRRCSGAGAAAQLKLRSGSGAMTAVAAAQWHPQQRSSIGAVAATLWQRRSGSGVAAAVQWQRHCGIGAAAAAASAQRQRHSGSGT
eukprot:2842418-Pleurochrysis_carterae.AAC.3